MTAEPVGSFTVPADHPCLPGHFPGRPIVPGVVLLDHALALLLGDGAPAAALSRVKFLAAVQAGQAIEVAAARGPDGRIDFTASHGALPVMRGRVVPGGAGA